MNSLGINKKPKNTKVVVAMSGGVDSSVVAGLMKEEGFDVLGITLKLYDTVTSSKQGRQCCAGQDILDAKRVSENLDINHEILYYQKKFKSEVIDTFIDSYVSGETPIPCVQCNQTVKFRDLFKYAKEKKADALITGHYVKRLSLSDKASMYRAEDISRDQSYFLFSTTQEQLDYLRFPLGNIDKKETRNIAKRLNLNVASKPDSQDICFVPNGDYGSVIKRFRPESFQKGKIINIEGKIIGEHDGIINFTIGQRKGIKIAGPEAYYVIKIVSDKNEIMVGPKQSLKISKIDLRNVNLLGNEEEIKKELYVKVRSTGKLIKSKIVKKQNQFQVIFNEGEEGVSPGQACVFYNSDRNGFKVLGGGWINETYNMLST